MNAVTSLPFPNARTLAGWWRLLAPQRPLALWVGYLFLHRVEALVYLHLEGHVEATVGVAVSVASGPARTIEQHGVPAAVSQVTVEVAIEFAGNFEFHFYRGDVGDGRVDRPRLYQPGGVAIRQRTVRGPTL